MDPDHSYHHLSQNYLASRSPYHHLSQNYLASRSPYHRNIWQQNYLATKLSGSNYLGTKLSGKNYLEQNYLALTKLSGNNKIIWQQNYLATTNSLTQIPYSVPHNIPPRLRQRRPRFWSVLSAYRDIGNVDSGERTPLSVQGNFAVGFMTSLSLAVGKIRASKLCGEAIVWDFQPALWTRRAPRPIYPKRRKRLSLLLGFNTQKTHQNLRFTTSCANFGAFSHGMRIA